MWKEYWNARLLRLFAKKEQNKCFITSELSAVLNGDNSQLAQKNENFSNSQI